MSARNIEEAVSAAVNFFDKLYEKEGFTGILLEEVRSHPSDNSGEVTIGYDRNAGLAKHAILGSPSARDYKVITVDKDSGEVKSIVIREAATR